jgi:hypothetical protein
VLSSCRPLRSAYYWMGYSADFSFEVL